MYCVLKKAAVAIVVFLFAAWGTAEAVEAGTFLGVSDVSGKPGETVEVVVSIQGFAALEGVEGISGGELVLVYDPAVADVQAAVAGEAISGFMFIRNLSLTENSIKIVWASGNRLTSADGEICRVSFVMSQGGSLRPTLKNLLLFDQDVQSLQVAALEPAPEGDVPSAGGEQEKNGEGTAGESPGGSNKGAPGEGAACYSIGLPDKTAPGSSGEAGQSGNNRDDAQGGTSADEAIPGQDDGQIVDSAAPGGKKPFWSTAAPWLIAFTAAALGLAGVVVYRKRRSKHHS